MGHTGEAYGLLSGLFMVPGTRDGFIYMMNGEAVAEDEDPRSAGNFSGNYVWEENVMNAICDEAFSEKREAARVQLPFLSTVSSQRPLEINSPSYSSSTSSKASLVRHWLMAFR